MVEIRSYGYSSLLTHITVCRGKRETREVTLIAELGLQMTADVRGKMNLTRLAQFSNCPGDLNLDGVVDDADFVLFVQAYDILDCGDVAMQPPCAGDLNGDLVVDDGDFVGFMGAYYGLVCE